MSFNTGGMNVLPMLTALQESQKSTPTVRTGARVPAGRPANRSGNAGGKAGQGMDGEAPRRGGRGGFQILASVGLI